MTDRTRQSSPRHPLLSRRLLGDKCDSSLEVGRDVLPENPWPRFDFKKPGGITDRFGCLESFKTPNTGAKRAGPSNLALDQPKTGIAGLTCALSGAPRQLANFEKTQGIARKSSGRQTPAQALAVSYRRHRASRAQHCDTDLLNADLAQLGALRAVIRPASQPVHNPRSGLVITLSPPVEGKDPAQTPEMRGDNPQSHGVDAGTRRDRALELTEGHAGAGTVIRPAGIAERETFSRASERLPHADFSILSTSAGNTEARDTERHHA